MQLTGIDLLFWWMGFLAHAVLLVVLFGRDRYRRFPIFTSFIAANVVRTLMLFLEHRYGSKTVYFYSFWWLAVLDTTLQVGVVYEMYSLTFRRLGVWARDVRLAFVWLVSVSVILAAGLSWMASPATRLWVQAAVIRASFFSSAWISELLAGMIYLSVSTGLPWRTYVARISAGLGCYSLIDVLIEAGHTYFGVSHDTQIYTDLAHIRMFAYLCCVSYWIASLWRDAPESVRLSAELRTRLTILQARVAYDLERIRTRR